jgi:predicted RNA polymerase sigma factor
MKMDKKKLSAAMAAVFAYIKTQEEAGAYGAVQGVEPILEQLAPSPRVELNLWGISGRQTHMQANSMMQLRLFK